MSSFTRMLLLSATALAAAGVPAVAQGAPAPAEIRLAVVDMDRVMAESEMGKMEQVGIDKLKADRTALIASKQKELDSMEEQIRNASLSWSDEKREDQSRQFEVKRVELRRLNEDATRDVQAEFNRSMTKLQKAALGVTGAIGREKGYTLVLEKNTVPVLYASDTIEITDDVIRRLNASRGAEAAKAPAAPAKPATNPPKPGGGR
ncbi:MAG: OmpH family outer membrane protein [Acidobacteria bacterium]|nr:OmpH family outer membrane protein [Acidobacteriota bacterium]